MVRFLLNGVEHQIESIDPNTTLLDYLRDRLHKTGTKEGCASGDCGACTVVLAEPQKIGLSYRAINACITPVASIHGKQLVTVEDLTNGAELHPAQAAMVDCHGSQCGFCTPGFVMSLFAYYQNAQDNPDRDQLTQINEALGGNLCRCTGYKPIVDAARQMFADSELDRLPAPESLLPKTIASEKRLIEKLKLLESESVLEPGLKQGLKPGAREPLLTDQAKRFYSPTSLEALSELLVKHPDARLLAGGTDLMLEVTQQLQSIETFIYLGRVESLTRYSFTERHLVIGAAVTYTDIKAPLTDLYPDLEELIDRLGSKQIRNQGTLGGNVANASPIADMPPVLIALGAELILRKGQETRQIKVEDYYLSYKKTALAVGEFIEQILVPKATRDTLFKAYKISKRLDDDISSTCGAFNIRLEDSRVQTVSIAYGGMAEIPKRAKHCEAALLNEIWNPQTIDKAMAALAKDFTPISDFRASADYRLRVSQNLLRRLYLELQSTAVTVPLRVTHA